MMQARQCPSACGSGQSMCIGHPAKLCMPTRYVITACVTKLWIMCMTCMGCVNPLNLRVHMACNGMRMQCDTL